MFRTNYVHSYENLLHSDFYTYKFDQSNLASNIEFHVDSVDHVVHFTRKLKDCEIRFAVSFVLLNTYLSWDHKWKFETRNEDIARMLLSDEAVIDPSYMIHPSITPGYAGQNPDSHDLTEDLTEDPALVEELMNLL